MKEQLESDLKQHKSSRAEAKEALAKAMHGTSHKIHCLKL